MFIALLIVGVVAVAYLAAGIFAGGARFSFSWRMLLDERGAVTLFQSEVWAKELLRNLFKDYVFASPAVVNRNYQGEISQQGDTVRITNIGAVTIGDYTGPGSVTWEELTDAQQSLLINQAKFFAFEVDDVDEAQSAGNGALMSEAMVQAADALANTADNYVASLYTATDAGNQLGTVSVTTATLADQQLIELNRLLNEANVPKAGRYCIIPPWYEALLLDDPNYINAEKSADGGAALRNGMIGRARGFDIYCSNNCVNVTGDDWAVQAGYPGAITYAEQINKTVATQLEDSFSDGVKGLHLYGAKVIRPTGLATVIASIT